jgi:hypothetical protein
MAGIWTGSGTAVTERLAHVMANWLSTILAAIGAGGRKAEADVSYDPALEDQATGGTPGSGGSDLSAPAEEPPRH